MRKKELEDLLALGGSFVADAVVFTTAELVRCAKAAKNGGGILTVVNTKALTLTDVSALCNHAPGHISFPEIIFEDFSRD